MSKPKKIMVNGFRIMHGIVQEGGARFSVLVDKPTSLDQIERIAMFMKHSVDQAREQIASAKNHTEAQDHKNMPLPEMKGDEDNQVTGYRTSCSACDGNGCDRCIPDEFDQENMPLPEMKGESTDHDAACATRDAEEDEMGYFDNRN